ncbi:MAG: OmpH family outer membrane protein [Planctomycetota bacterium]|nr:MAG: OmpH family outer membrane protein [Planctomycetota bacterium]
MTRRVSWLTVVLVALAVWTVSTTINQAQTSIAPAKQSEVGVVDLVYVFNEFEQTKTLNALMKDRENKIREEMAQKMQELNVEASALKAFDPASEDYAKREKEFQEKLIEARSWEFKQREIRVANHLRWLKRTYDTVTAEIAKVAKTKGIVLVVTREELDMSKVDSNTLYQQIMARKVVYSDPVIDLTEEVLTSMNAAFERAGGASSVDLSK